LVPPKKKGHGFIPWPFFYSSATGSLSRSAHGLFSLTVQAEEGRRAPKAKVAKIKEAILLFSCRHPLHFSHKIISLFNTFYWQKSTEKVGGRLESLGMIIIYYL
jgi:hypothetical protein